MLAVPFRWRVLELATARLATIPQAPWGTYRTMPALVTAELLLSITPYEAQLMQGPILGVMRSSGSMLERQRHEPLSSPPEKQLDAYSDTFRFTVWGYVKGAGGIPAGQVLEDLWQDHVVCLLGDAMLFDPTLGKPLLRRLELEGTETDGGVIDPFGWFAQEWAAIGDPTRTWP